MAGLKPRLGVCVTMSPLEVGANEAENILREAISYLEKLNLELVVAKDVVCDDKTVAAAMSKFKEKEIDLLCLIEATWSEDYLVTDMLRQIDVPVIIWALPGIHTGSLCGSQQLCSVLKELDMKYKFVYGDIGENKVHQKVLNYSQAVALKRVLKTSRLGLIGYRVKGMTEVTFDELEMMSVFGPRTIHYGIGELKEKMADVSLIDIEHKWNQVKAQVGRIEVDQDEVLHSIKVYLALKEFIKEDKLSGIAIECYPHLMGEVCLAASLLAEEGIVTACEGDMNSALAMFILYQLTGQPIHNTDLLAVYEEDNSIVFSHCGSGGFSLAETKEQIVLSPVRLMNKGCCVLFPAKPGPVTLVNLVGRKGTYRMAIAPGEAISTGMIFPGNPIRVRFKTPIAQILDTIATEGIGHHWMIGYGDVKDTLIDLCDLVSVRSITI